MIEFINNITDEPYKRFKSLFNKARRAGQKPIDAISISSFSKSKNEVDSRFVNLKFIDGKKFIFFSNYNSPKSIAFDEHDQISALIYWQKINIQIRLKAKIKKTNKEFNESYFKNRSANKNALAISSNQSREISSYDEVIRKYDYTKENKDLKKCPAYWGGFCFSPYSFEFWEGSDSRLNKRDLYVKTKDSWKHSILEP